MASGLFLRLQAQRMPIKMYGFEAVDRDRQREIVARLTAPSRASSSTVSAAAAAAAASQRHRPTTAPADDQRDRDSDSDSDPDSDRHGGHSDEDDDEAVCERYRVGLTGEARPRRLLAAEDYSRALFARLGRSHTFSSRCKQRSLDPHRLCSREPGELPDYAPIRDINKAAAAAPTQKKLQQQQQQQQQRQGPSLSAVLGFSRMASRAAAMSEAGQSPERRQEAVKQKASPFGLLFRTSAQRDADGGGGAERTVASTAVFGALGRLRYRAKRDEIQQQERDQRARRLRSDWEIVNATEFVRSYERENSRGMRLAVIGRPTVSSRFKGVGGGACPFCQEMPELASDWQQRLAVSGGGAAERDVAGEDEEPAKCQRCGRFHGVWKAPPKSAVDEEPLESAGGPRPPPAQAEAAPTETAAAGAVSAPANAWGSEEEAALVARLRAPTRASEGGRPFCQRGQADAGPWLGSALLGFETQRPKSALEWVRSAQKRRELIDAMSVRLHSGAQRPISGRGAS